MAVRQFVSCLLGVSLLCCLTSQSAGSDEQPRMLSTEGFFKASAFISKTARPIERSLFAFHFAHGGRDAVIAELAKFQNRDGGFASYLESDTRWRGSSPLGTMKALRIFNEVGAPVENDSVRASIHYLLATFDKSKGYWHALPKEANSAPHAPWWDVHENTGKSEVESPVFPTAAIAGYLQAYSRLLPQGFLDRITTSSLDYLFASNERISMPDMEMLTQLVQYLPSSKSTEAIEKLKRAIATVVVREPRNWGAYNVKPLTFIASPDSPFYAGLEDAIPTNLDYIISGQNADGGWELTWSWEKIDPDAWAAAEKEWRGAVTLENLEKLEAFGRIAHETTWRAR